MRCSFAVAQTCPVVGNVNANLREHLRLIEIASAEAAQLVLFPELSLTGYEINLAGRLAFSENDSRLSCLIEAASAGSLTIVVGAPISIAGSLYIGAFIIRADGSTAIYTKHYLGAFTERAQCDGVLPPAEATVFQPGSHNPAVQFGGRHAAIAICADVGRPSHAQSAADRGARIYLASMFVIPSEFESEAAKLRGYAARHSMTVAMANFGRASGGLAAAGRSSIWSENGELLAQLNPSGAGLALGDQTEHGWRTKTIALD